MELHFNVKSLNRKRAIGKAGYILRKNMDCRKSREKYTCSKSNEDLIFSDTLTVKGMPDDYSDPEILLDSLLTDSVSKQSSSNITRDWCANLSNKFICYDENGKIDKEKTSRLLKPAMNKYFKDNFVDKEKTAVIYAVHCSKNKDGIYNLHVHWESLCFEYENNHFLSKTYRDEKGKKQYRNSLDSKYQSYNTLRELRGNLAETQNKLLEKMGIESKVEYKSYEERKIDKIPSTHLEKSQFDEICMLKRKYADIEDIAFRNETIIKENSLTDKQIKFLNTESYNYRNSHDESYNRSFIKKADSNRKKGFTGYAARSVLKSMVSKGMSELSQAADETVQETNYKGNYRER